MSIASANLQALLELSGDEFEAMLRNAADCYTEGHLSQATTILAGLIAIQVTDPRPYKLLGSCMLLQNQHLDAESTYEQALKLDPEDPYTLVALGELRLKSLKISQAVPLFEKLFKLDPNGEHPAANRGRQLVKDYYKKISS